MQTVPTVRMSGRAERRAIAALVAVFALLVQALIPSLAAASAPLQDHGVICATPGAGGHGGTEAPGQHQGGGCDHCVCPSVAGPPNAVTEVATPVLYAYAADLCASRPQGLAPGRGLAAPPPPSRGPPSLTI